MRWIVLICFLLCSLFAGWLWRDRQYDMLFVVGTLEDEGYFTVCMTLVNGHTACKHIWPKMDLGQRKE